MKQKFTEKIKIPEGITCEFADGILRCRKGSAELKRKINFTNLKLTVQKDEITIECEKGNKINYKTVKSLIAHFENMFRGVDEKFIYKLEACNVHFPMTVKAEGGEVLISNFLGEKTPRKAKILPDVEVKISGQAITISSHNREAAGQTAANIEQATKVRGRDRRIYQDGIFIVEKPGRIG